MSDVQFIWFFILCAVLWVLFSTACWYKITCDNNEGKRYFRVKPDDVIVLVLCIISGPLVWFLVLLSSLTIKNHFYRGY